MILATSQTYRDISFAVDCEVNLRWFYARFSSRLSATGKLKLRSHQDKTAILQSWLPRSHFFLGTPITVLNTNMMATCLQTSVTRPTVQPRSTQRSARPSGLIRCSAQNKASSFVDARKAAAFAAAASLLLVSMTAGFAGHTCQLCAL